MNKILEMKFGSHLYGTDTENSDLDLKAIYIPSAREILLHSYPRTINTCRPKQEFERNKKDDVDIEVFSLDRYLQLLTQGQAVALDMLFAPDSMYTERKHYWIMDYIRSNKDKFLSKDVTAFFGYAKQQAAKYGIKGTRISALRLALDMFQAYKDKSEKLYECDLDMWVHSIDNEFIKIVQCKAPNNKMEPHLEVCNRKFAFHAGVKYVISILQKILDQYGGRALQAEKNEGIDWKALSHAVRVNSQADELLRTGHITFPRPDRQLLLDIKTGKMDYKEVAQIIEDGLANLEEVQKTSDLRDEPDYEFMNDFICQIYKEVVVWNG